MGRKRTIDKEQVLEAAERVAAEKGAAALSIGSVADAAGISKGGVQSTFGTKEAMILAMLDRWLAIDQGVYRNLAGDNAAASGRVKAHIASIRGQSDVAQSRALSLLAVLVQSPEHLQSTKDWYQERIGSLFDGAANMNAQIAFLAAEGAYFLRFFGLVDFGSDQWDHLLDRLDMLANRMD